MYQEYNDLRSILSHKIVSLLVVHCCSLLQKSTVEKSSNLLLRAQKNERAEYHCVWQCVERFLKGVYFLDFLKP